jgi:hypothetical protein
MIASLSDSRTTKTADYHQNSRDVTSSSCSGTLGGGNLASFRNSAAPGLAFGVRDPASELIPASLVRTNRKKELASV